MISASAAAECGPAIDVPEAAPYRGCGTPSTTCTVVLLMPLLGAVTHDHFARPHRLNVCCPGTRTEPSASKVRPVVLMPDVVYQRPSRSGRKYGAAPRGVGFAAPALPAVNWMMVPGRATSMAPCIQRPVLPFASTRPSGSDQCRNAVFRPKVAGPPGGAS